MSNMIKLPSSFEMKKYGLYFRFVNEEDSEFIVQLRSDPELGKYLSKTEHNVEKQKEWIRAYKQRENEGIDYYFVVYYKSEKCGLIRLYDITEKTFTPGSWIFKKNAPPGVSLLADIIIVTLAFELFPEKECVYDIRKENKNSLGYTRLFDPIIIGEDELNYYFIRPKENFYKTKKRLLEIFHIESD